jgi:CRISPR/Cas system-associated protein Cas10 (large subunit of type III CRISPR-Cas system)
MPEFWRRVSIIYSGGDDFAIYGSRDALIPLAREVASTGFAMSLGEIPRRRR